MKLLYLLTFLTAFSFSCFSQNAASQDTPVFDFWDITFHSSACNGTCPDISMNINSERKVQLIRTIYTKKGVSDTTRSGGYKGELSLKEYDQLLKFIKTVDWDNLKFEKVTCCDKPIKTIIIGYNGRSKQLKSMELPKETEKLVAYLTDLALNLKLPKYSRPMDFEEVLD